jgi:DNA-binding transcriptional ArsR family regulator
LTIDAWVLLNTGMGKLKTDELEKKAGDLAALLRMFANEHRLLILCQLVECGEANVNALAEDVGLSPSALSQHLTKMKAEGVVTFRRDSQTLWYRIADRRVEELFATLHRLFCGDSKR